MSVSEDQIKEALKTVKYPGFSRDIVSFGLVKGIEARNGNVTVNGNVAKSSTVIRAGDVVRATLPHAPPEEALGYQVAVSVPVPELPAVNPVVLGAGSGGIVNGTLLSMVPLI